MNILQNNKDMDAPHTSQPSQFIPTEGTQLQASARPSIGSNGKQHSVPGATPQSSTNHNAYDAQGAEKGWASFEDDSQGGYRHIYNVYGVRL